MADDRATYRFLSGAEMDPTAVLARFPGARFVARARLLPDANTTGADDEVWGILIRLPAATAATDEPRQAETDDGRRFPALVEGSGRPADDPKAVLAAARYWELPPAYVRRLPAPPLADAE